MYEAWRPSVARTSSAQASKPHPVGASSGSQQTRSGSRDNSQGAKSPANVPKSGSAPNRWNQQLPAPVPLPRTQATGSSSRASPNRELSNSPPPTPKIPVAKAQPEKRAPAISSKPSDKAATKIDQLRELMEWRKQDLLDDNEFQRMKKNL